MKKKNQPSPAQARTAKLHKLYVDLAYHLTMLEGDFRATQAGLAKCKDLASQIHVLHSAKPIRRKKKKGE